jgi:hypothetical protein
VLTAETLTAGALTDPDRVTIVLYYTKNVIRWAKVFDSVSPPQVNLAWRHPEGLIRPWEGRREREGQGNEESEWDGREPLPLVRFARRPPLQQGPQNIIYF